MEVLDYEIRGLSKGSVVNLVLFSCTHFGHMGIALDKLAKEIDKTKDDPLARWVHLGDAGEFISKNDPRWQLDALDRDYHCDAPVDLQVDKTADYFSRIKRQGIGFIMGNHEDKYLLNTQSNPGRRIANKLGIAFLGFTALLTLHLHSRNGSIWSPQIFLTHGDKTRAQTPQGQMAFLKKISYPFMQSCDVAAMSHVHHRGIDNNDIHLRKKGREIVEDPKHFVIAGTFMKTYYIRGNGTAGYGEKAHYSPSALGCSSIRFDVSEREIWAIDRWS